MHSGYGKLPPVHQSWLLLVLLAAFCLPSLGESGLVSHPAVNPGHVDGSSLGSAIDLSSTWLFKQGDDPSYADPHLDDRQWTVVSANRPLRSYGFRNIDLCWYRTHVHVPTGSHDLEILLRGFHGSEQIFVNGVEVGSSGPFPPAVFREITRWIVAALFRMRCSAQAI